MKYKTVKDVDLVMFSTDKFPGMSLCAIKSNTGAAKMFAPIYFLHLLNINGSNGRKIVFNKEFKEFLKDELLISERSVSLWMKRLVKGDYIQKEDGVYKFTEKMKELFKKEYKKTHIASKI